MSTETRRIQFEFVSRDRGVGRDMEQIGRQAEDTGTNIEEAGGRGGKAMAGLQKGLGAVGGAMAVVSAAALGIGMALSKGMDAQAGTAKLQAQLGLTKTESERVGRDAGKLYSQAYGESLDEVKGAITSVIRNMDGMRTASSADLQQTTARAMDLATVMEEEVGRVTMAVSQMMRTGLAKNSREAFDILTRGAQLGADKAQDLLDTFNEYGTQFRDLGVSGKQALGLIVQGLKGGARDADIVGDAFKELNIRVRDMSAGPALKQLGLNAKEMSAAFGKGGPVAAAALDRIMDKLRAVKSPTERYALAQKLLGTQSEDMAEALNSLDPSKAVEALGQVEGATDRAGKALGETAKARATAFKRTLETNVVNFIGGTVLPALDKMKAQLSGASIKVAPKMDVGRTRLAPADTGEARQLTALEKAGIKLRSMWAQLSSYMTRNVVPALKQIGRWVKDELIPAYQKFYSSVLRNVLNAFKGVKKTIDDNKVSLQSLGKFLGAVATFITRHVVPVVAKFYGLYIKALGLALQLLIKIIANSWKAVRTWAGIVGTMASFVTRVFLAMVTGLVKGAARAFGWVPGLGGKLKSAAKAVEGFKDKTNAAIDKIRKGKTVTIDVKAKGHWAFGVDPSLIRSRHHFGGPVTGKGQPGASRHRDSVVGALRVDEHVITPEEVDAAGGHQAVFRIRKAMRQGLLKGFYNGGPVGMNVRASTPNSASMDRSVWKPLNTGTVSLVTAVAKELARVMSMFGGAMGVVQAARSKIGLPYSWGGGGKGGPSYGIGRGAGTMGFDCSGLTEYAWWKGARKSIGGTTYSQWPNSRPSPRRPGALGFPHMGHVVIASDKPGYIIQAPYTGSHVQEVPAGRGYDWRWPKAAGFYAGGPVKAAGEGFTLGYTARGARGQVRAVGIAGDPRLRMEGRAAGGPVRAHVPYVVGERGPEIIVPRQGGNVLPAGSSIANVEVHVHVDGHVIGDLDPVKLTNTIFNAARRAKKRGVSVQL